MLEKQQSSEMIESLELEISSLKAQRADDHAKIAQLRKLTDD